MNPDSQKRIENQIQALAHINSQILDLLEATLRDWQVLEKQKVETLKQTLRTIQPPREH